MSTSPHPGAPQGSASPGATAAPPAGPPGPPRADMMGSAEMQAYLAQLRDEERRLGMRNKVLWGSLAAGLLVLLIILWGVYRATVGAYAVIGDLEIRQHPVDQGRLDIHFRVHSPGKVHCRRVSGGVQTDLIDHFDEPCSVDRPWSWTYRPGKPVELTIWYRRGLLRRTHQVSFPTTDRADVVILADTTGSMSPYLDELKEKCAEFSAQLKRQSLEHRFALLGFGDTAEGPWLDRHGFTADVAQFAASVENVKRFDGGDLPESALDALEEALRLAYDEGALRRFYLVTDAGFHEPTRSGLSAEQVAARLAEQQVMLRVFSKREFEADYTKLLGETGKFQEIEHFGRVLSEGRLLGD